MGWRWTWPTATQRRIRSRIAIVFRDFVKYPSLTGAENIGIGLPARIGDRPAIVEAARRAGAAAVTSLYRHRSAVLISHRLSSVPFADRICVLADGRITESGAHEDCSTRAGTTPSCSRSRLAPTADDSLPNCNATIWRPVSSDLA